MVGFDDTKTALIALHKSYKVALDASKKDDEVDDDGDGIPDVKQIPSKELVQVIAVAKAIDPEPADAVTAINAGSAAVVATISQPSQKRDPNPRRTRALFFFDPDLAAAGHRPPADRPFPAIDRATA